MNLLIATLAVIGIFLHLILRFFVETAQFYEVLPLWVVLVLGGVPLVWELGRGLLRGKFSSDLLAGISIVGSIALGEYLAGSLVVLMLSGGEALESFAVAKASSALSALASRVPPIAHKKTDKGVIDVPLSELGIGDELIVFPHEVAPTDGVVIEGRSTMDESYLTGEPYMLEKTPGAEVISGAINGQGALTIRSTKLAIDSRYARIMEVVKKAENQKPQIRRLGDKLGAWYTPAALLIASLAWFLSGDPLRFLSVVVIATPCPLLIAIPVAVIGSISLAAQRSIIVKDPAVLEIIDTCKTFIFDKTGTLTYGVPVLTDVYCANDFSEKEVLMLAASLERYSRHPLALPIKERAEKFELKLIDAQEVREEPGMGLIGKIGTKEVAISSRKKTGLEDESFPKLLTGLECLIVVDGKPAALFRFKDEPRQESGAFLKHLSAKHSFRKLMIVSGDRESEVMDLAGRVGISEVHAGKSPEQKVEIVKAETQKARTVFIGDGINDAPALLSATVGIAIGQRSDVTAEAAGAVLMDNSLLKVDELLHIGRRMRNISLQSALGGMAISIIGMGFSAFGLLTPVAGAVIQEIIDLFAVLNALRATVAPKRLIDVPER